MSKESEQNALKLTFFIHLMKSLRAITKSLASYSMLFSTNNQDLSFQMNRPIVSAVNEPFQTAACTAYRMQFSTCDPHTLKKKPELYEYLLEISLLFNLFCIVN